jgi:O-antigen/teichoic acid export membrane protein
MESIHSQESISKQNPFGFYSASILLLIFNNLANVFQYIFQAMMGRHLSTVDFGLMNSLIQFGVFLALPVNIYAAVMTRRWAELTNVSEHEKVNQMGWSFLCLGIGISVSICFVAFLFAPCIGWWLNTSDLSAVRLLAIGTIFATVFGLAIPFATAKQWFPLLSFGGLFSSIFRIFVGWFGIHLEHAFYGGVIASSVYLVILFFFVFRKIPSRDFNHISFEKMVVSQREWIEAILLSLGAFFIVGSDLLIVQHFYKPHEAGLFAQVIILGRIIFFLIGPLTAVILPKSATSLMSDEAQEKRILRRALVLSFVALVMAASVISAFAPLAFQFLRGNSDAEIISYLRIAVWCFIPISLCQLVLPSLFAKRKERFLAEFSLLSILLPIGIAVFHQKLIYAFFVEGAVGVLLLLYVLTRFQTSLIRKVN